MTAQRPENFENRCPSFDIGNLSLIGIRGYDLKYEIEKPEKAFISALWRGYIGNYVLRDDGSLILESVDVFTGKRDPKFEHKEVNEEITGDFWLDFRERFFGAQIHIPFESGKVVLDKSKWKRISSTRGDSGLIEQLFPNVKEES